MDIYQNTFLQLITGNNNQQIYHDLYGELCQYMAVHLNKNSEIVHQPRLTVLREEENNVRL